MGLLFRTSLLLLSSFTITNALVLPRSSDSTLPDSGCLNTTAGSCESNWDRIPTFLKAIIIIAAFLAFGFIVGLIHRFTNFTKSLLPTWMRSSRNQPRPPTQAELVMCWQRYGPKDGDGRPRAGSQKELERLWRQSGERMRLQLLVEGPRGGHGEASPFITHGVTEVAPAARNYPEHHDGFTWN